MKNINQVQLEILMATATSLIERMMKNLRLGANLKAEIRDYLLSRLGEKVAQDPQLIDAFMQSFALLRRALLNFRADFFRDREKLERREAPIPAEAGEKDEAFSQVLFNLYLSQILTPDAERFARLKLMGLTDTEVMKVTGESRNALAKHKDRIRSQFLQVFQE